MSPPRSKPSSSLTSAGPSRPARLSGFMRLRIPACESALDDLLLSREAPMGSDFRPRRLCAGDVVLSSEVQVRARLSLGCSSSSGADRLGITSAYNLDKKNERRGKRVDETRRRNEKSDSKQEIQPGSL